MINFKYRKEKQHDAAIINNASSELLKTKRSIYLDPSCYDINGS
jgi:hypothetical protein